MNNKSHFSEWRLKVKRQARLAWIIWSVALAAQSLNMINRVSASPAVDRIMSELAVTAASWGALMSMYFYIYGLMQLPSGIMADNLGPRKTITIGMFVSSIGTVVFGLAPSLTVLIIGRFILSLGVSLIYVNFMRLIVDWFKPRNFARMVGINSFLGTIATIVGTAPMAWMISVFDWRISFEILAAVTLIICIVCWFVIRNKPADMNLPSPLQVEGIHLSSIPYAKEKSGPKPAIGHAVKIALSSKHTWIALAISAGLYGTLLVFIGAWGMPYLMQVYGISRNQGANLISLLLVAHLFGDIGVPFFSDRIRRRKLPQIIMAIIYFFAIVLLVFGNSGYLPMGMLIPVLILIGFSSSSTIMAFVIVRENLTASVFGIALGIMNIGAFLFAAILQMLIGFVLDSRWQGVMEGGIRIYSLSDFQAGFMVLIIPALAAVIGSFLMRETYCRNQTQ